MDEPGQTFKPAAACTATGLARKTLDTWAARGYLRNFDAADARVGVAREFTLADVLALALIKEASDRGITSAVLPDISHSFAEMFLENREDVRECVIRYYGTPGGHDAQVSMLPNEDVMAEPPQLGARTTIRFDLGAIFGPVLATLGEAAPTAKAA